MPKITTYPEMNEQIVKLLRVAGKRTGLYAAQRIEELEGNIERLQLQLQHSEQVLTRREDQLRQILHVPIRTLGDACPTCGGTEWLCVDCMDSTDKKG